MSDRTRRSNPGFGTSIRRRKTKIRLAALGSVVAMVLVGCSASPSQDPGNDGAAPLLGITSRFIAGNSWLGAMVDRVVAEGEELGYEVSALDARGDAQTQIQQMQTLVARGAKAIIIEPIDDTAVAAGVEAAINAGIPVIAINDELNPDLASRIACSVNSDQFALGVLLGEKTAEAVAAKYSPDDTVELYVMAILPQEPLTTKREEGFMQGYEDYFAENEGPTTKRIENGYGSALPDETLPVMRDKLSGNPGVDVIFNQTDTVHGAVMQALQEASMVNADGGDSSVIVASMDGRMEVIQDMAETPGYAVVANSLTAPGASSALAVAAAHRAVEAGSGNEPVCEGEIPTEHPPVEVVTQETAPDYIDPEAEFAEPTAVN